MRSPFSNGRRRLAAASLALAVFVSLIGPAAAAPRAPVVLVLTDFPVRASVPPDDTFYVDQWGLRTVDAEDAWSVNPGSRAVIVAVVDTGVWWTHNDIRGNMWDNSDGTHGYDFISDDTNPMDEDTAGGTFHGTGVAGVIAALTDNAYQIAGAAQVSVMALRSLGPSGEGSSLNTSRAIRWAADHGARIINLSLGTNDTFTQPSDMEYAIDYAWSRGALVVAAAGNGGTASLDFPARLPTVVSVASVSESGTRSSFSNYGSGLDISAPGERILTLTANHQIHYLAGTSLAAPYVSAAAALLLSEEPSLTNVDLWNILNETAVPVGSRYNTGYGWGVVNYWNAINALNRPFISVNAYPGSVSRSASFSIGWSILGPAGLSVADTHVEWGTASGVLTNSTSPLTGVTRQNYTTAGLRMPEGASTLYFKVVATVNGTRYESPERTVIVSNLPDFLFVLYNLFSSNLLLLALFVLVLAAVVAFVPQRRRRVHVRRAPYHVRTPTSVVRPSTPPPGPPPAAPASSLSQMRPAAGYVPAPPPPVEPARPAEPFRSEPIRPAPPPPPPAAAKKRCPNCGTLVNADNMFCFFCGHTFR